MEDNHLIFSDQFVQMKLGRSLQTNIVENAFRLNIRKRQYHAFNQQMKLVNIPAIGERLFDYSESILNIGECLNL